MELFVPRVFAVFRTNVSKIKKRGQKKKKKKRGDRSRRGCVGPLPTQLVKGLCPISLVINESHTLILAHSPAESIPR